VFGEELLFQVLQVKIKEEDKMNKIIVLCLIVTFNFFPLFSGSDNTMQGDLPLYFWDLAS
jgi:hypothetical protein